MSQLLDALRFPLHGSRLIEASAGTGKTWTIAALYLRLVLGHGEHDGNGDSPASATATAFSRALAPSEILVMTFTRAATRELSNRVRERLIEAAAYFRGESTVPDPMLAALAASYPDEGALRLAAHRLVMAAETMDEAAIFTIDAWCQRMLREHAFDSGSLFDEELVSDEHALFDDAAHDYWRQNVYPLSAVALATLLGCWSDVAAMKQGVRELVRRAATLGQAPEETLARLIERVASEQAASLGALKQGWHERAGLMEQWIAAQRELAPKCFNGNKLRPDSLAKWFDALRAWAGDDTLHLPAMSDTAWHRLTPDGISDAFSKGFSSDIPACFDCTTDLWEALKAIDPVAHALHRHAVGSSRVDLQACKLEYSIVSPK